MNRNSWLDEVQRNLSDLIARSPAADLQRNAKAMMTDAFSRMDLVTREEFDVQVEVLARTRAKLDALEAQLRRLEGHDSTPSATTAPATNPAAAMGAFAQSAAASAATTSPAGSASTPAASPAQGVSTPSSSATSSILTPSGVPFGAGSSGGTPPAGNTGSAPVSSPSSAPASGAAPAANPPKEGDLAM